MTENYNVITWNKGGEKKVLAVIISITCTRSIVVIMNSGLKTIIDKLRPDWLAHIEKSRYESKLPRKETAAKFRSLLKGEETKS